MRQTDTLIIGGGQAGLAMSHHLSEGGITPAPGLYVLGLKLQRTRKSTFIDGVGDDARAVAEQITSRLAHPRTAAA